MLTDLEGMDGIAMWAATVLFVIVGLAFLAHFLFGWGELDGGD